VKKVCVITGTRAEYGLLRWVIEGIRDSAQLHLQLAVTGMHLSPEFGMTVNAIEEDGLKIDRRVEMLLSSDSAVGTTKSMGLGMIGFADAFSDLKPDLLLILGDRYEIFAAAAAATIARIPIAHLHGGEATEGLIDEPIRHSVTKMSHLHFVAACEYRDRVIQLGEHPDRVFLVGGLGVDSIRKLDLLSRPDLESELGFRFRDRNLLVTFHPVTLEGNASEHQMDQLLATLSELQEVGLIFTMPNADPEGRALFGKIEKFCADNENAVAYTSLGQRRYLSCMKYVDGVVGNSSSGLIEAPSLNTGTVNIGDRQRGRLRADSVIDCEPTKASIEEALNRLWADDFQKVIKNARNPYGDGGASDAIVRLLENAPFENILKKRFFDIAL
jgi:GDP/UDP-N,N'-diacetylbacillosamine 2-epimerase (hydrolysing)